MFRSLWRCRTETIRLTSWALMWSVWCMRTPRCLTMHDRSFRLQSSPCLSPGCCLDNRLPISIPKPRLISWTGIILPPVICSLFVISAANGAYERKRNSSFSVSGRESRQRRGDDALQTMLRCSWFPLRWYRWVFSPPALPINGNTARAYDEPQIFHSGSTYNAFKLCNIISGCL